MLPLNERRTKSYLRRKIRDIIHMVGHLQIELPAKLMPTVFWSLFSWVAASPRHHSVIPSRAERAIDHANARQLHDLIVDNLLKDNRIGLRNQMEKGAADYYDAKSFTSLVDQMFAMYGKPLDAEFKRDEIGLKNGTGGYDKNHCESSGMPFEPRSTKGVLLPNVWKWCSDGRCMWLALVLRVVSFPTRCSAVNEMTYRDDDTQQRVGPERRLCVC